jgi:hypothetical protein
MKRFASPLSILLVIVASSIRGAAAADDSSALLSSLAAAVAAAGGGEAAGDDWTSALACTVKTDGNPSLVDEPTCVADAKDSNGNPCVWCDASAVIGTGLCVSADDKEMAGQYWDMLCGASSPSAVPPPTPPALTPPPTPPPVPAPPAPAPDDGIPDELRCSMDSSRNVISDEVKCSAQKDAGGASCEWCEVPIIGGSCVTASMKSQIGFLCSSKQQRRSNLRAAAPAAGGDDDGKGGGGWKGLDPSCLGDSVGGLGGTKEGCASRTDSNGEACVWCDAGNDVFGICATSDQKEYLGGYLDCDAEEDRDSDTDAVVAVE